MRTGDPGKCCFLPELPGGNGKISGSARYCGSPSQTQGTFNFEVTSHFTDIRRDTYSQAAFQQACNLLYEIGRSLADIAEGKSFAD